MSIVDAPNVFCEIYSIPKLVVVDTFRSFKS